MQQNFNVWLSSYYGTGVLLQLSTPLGPALQCTSSPKSLSQGFTDANPFCGKHSKFCYMGRIGRCLKEWAAYKLEVEFLRERNRGELPVSVRGPSGHSGRMRRGQAWDMGFGPGLGKGPVSSKAHGLAGVRANKLVVFCTGAGGRLRAQGIQCSTEFVWISGSISDV